MIKYTNLKCTVEKEKTTTKQPPKDNRPNNTQSKNENAVFADNSSQKIKISSINNAPPAIKPSSTTSTSTCSSSSSTTSPSETSIFQIHSPTPHFLEKYHRTQQKAKRKRIKENMNYTGSVTYFLMNDFFYFFIFQHSLSLITSPRKHQLRTDLKVSPCSFEAKVITPSQSIEKFQILN